MGRSCSRWERGDEGREAVRAAAVWLCGWRSSCAVDSSAELDAGRVELVCGAGEGGGRGPPMTASCRPSRKLSGWLKRKRDSTMKHSQDYRRHWLPCAGEVQPRSRGSRTRTLSLARNACPPPLELQKPHSPRHRCLQRSATSGLNSCLRRAHARPRLARSHRHRLPRRPPPSPRPTDRERFERPSSQCVPRCGEEVVAKRLLDEDGEEEDEERHEDGVGRRAAACGRRAWSSAPAHR